MASRIAGQVLDGFAVKRQSCGDELRWEAALRYGAGRDGLLDRLHREEVVRAKPKRELIELETG